MRATLILADYARVAEGKLDVIGGGWTAAGPGPVTMAIGVLVEVPWDERAGAHVIRLRLQDADGRQVQIQGPEGPPNPVEIGTEFQIQDLGKDHPDGAPVPFALAVNVPNLPLPGGQRFEWWLEIDGRTDVTWRVAFSTRRG